MGDVMLDSLIDSALEEHKTEIQKAIEELDEDEISDLLDSIEREVKDKYISSQTYDAASGGKEDMGPRYSTGSGMRAPPVGVGGGFTKPLKGLKGRIGKIFRKKNRRSIEDSVYKWMSEQASNLESKGAESIVIHSPTLFGAGVSVTFNIDSLVKAAKGAGK
jgi:hypothetical protein